MQLVKVWTNNIFWTENVLPSCMNEFTWLMNIPQRRSYNSLRSSKPPTKNSTIIQSNSCNQRVNSCSLWPWWQAQLLCSSWCHSLEQWAQVLKANSNLLWSLTDHTNYYRCICVIHMLHSSYLQVLSFNYNVIN